MPICVVFDRHQNVKTYVVSKIFTLDNDSLSKCENRNRRRKKYRSRVCTSHLPGSISPTFYAQLLCQQFCASKVQT